METITETALKGLSHLPEQWEKSNRGVKRRRPSQPCATQTVNGNCRKDTKFAELEKTHPRPCGYALDEIGKIYEHEAVARRMSDEDRQAYHEKLSLPIMSKLRQWMKQEIEDKRVEPNSGLGKAMAYFENQYELLVQFCRVLGAPIDNNIVERALKAPVMIRKNSYFYKTGNGAGIGGIILSVLIADYCDRERPILWMVNSIIAS